MSQPGPRQTKRQKKALAFRTRQKTGKKKNRDLDDEDAIDFPIDENQDLAGLADLPLEAAEVLAGSGQGGRKGKAEDGGQRQAQSAGSKKRKSEGEEVTEERSQKRPKIRPAVLESDGEDGDVKEKVETKKRAQPQRFILFIGVYIHPPAPETSLTCDGHRQPEVHHDKRYHSFSFLLLW